MSKENNIVKELKDGVLTIKLNRSKKLNSFSIDMYKKIETSILEA